MDFWQDISPHVEQLKGIYLPTSGKELVDICMLVAETACQFLGTLRIHINHNLSKHEPVCLVLGTAAVFFSFYMLRRLTTYDGFIPSNKRPGFLQRFRELPIMRSIVARKLAQVEKDIEKDLKKEFKNVTFKLLLNEKGIDSTSILQEMKHYGELGGVDWSKGKVSGAIYSKNDIVYENMMTQVFNMNLKANHLHSDVFAGVRKMEAEIIRWVIDLFHGDEDSCGSISSGGTESIMLACKAYRDYAFKEKGITKPEIIVPDTAHAAFDKAAEWCRLEIIKIPVDPKTKKVNLKKMKQAITKNTIMLVGSAPQYPHGIMDPIEEIGALGYRYGIPVHVDCCLGGFIMPFMNDAGFPVPPFDFTVKGVTSISADTHKYAMAPKGTSIVMYADRKVHHCQFSAAGDWPGGLYITPTIAGSRQGAVVACCWAALRYNGREGYVNSCREVISQARKIKEGVKQIEGLEILGDPLATVVAFTSTKFNIFELSNEMAKLGWHMNPLQFPSAIHFCVTPLHAQTDIAADFIKDLKRLSERLLSDPNRKVSSGSAVYGLAQTIPDRSLVQDMLYSYMDIIYSTKDVKE